MGSEVRKLYSLSKNKNLLEQMKKEEDEEKRQELYLKYNRKVYVDEFPKDKLKNLSNEEKLKIQENILGPALQKLEDNHI